MTKQSIAPVVDNLHTLMTFIAMLFITIDNIAGIWTYSVLLHLKIFICTLYVHDSTKLLHINDKLRDYLFSFIENHDTIDIMILYIIYIYVLGTTEHLYLCVVSIFCAILHIYNSMFQRGYQ